MSDGDPASHARTAGPASLARAAGSASLARAVALAGWVALATLAAGAYREIALGRDAVAASDAAASHADWLEAIAQARAAAEAATPGSPWPERGGERLEAIAHDAEARGDDTTAVLAYGALESAARAAPTYGSRSARWRAAAEEGVRRVAAMRADTPRERPAASGSPDMSERRTEGAPAGGALAAASIAALAMGVGLAGLARGGMRPGARRAAAAIATAGLAVYAAVFLMN
jgi:hypothetical protein